MLFAEAVGLGLSAAGIGTSIFGGASKDAAARDAVNRQYESDTRNWRFSNREQNRRYRYDKKGLKVLKANTETELQYKEATAQREYGYQLAIQGYEQRNAERQWAQSEKIYKQQLSFNNIAAARAYEAESRRFEEVKIGQAFQSQDLMVEGLLEEGKAALLQPGRSGRKGAQSSLASYGRNVAILDESLRSAQKQHVTNLQKVDLEKLGADLAAEAGRMIKPERLPEIPPPLALPRPKYQKVYKPKKTPRPIKGVAATGGMSSAVADSVATLGSLNWGAAFPSGGGFDFGKLFG
jgi:hypothetical protein